MNKYKVFRPQYFTKFKCIGGECEDICCKDWNITIDRKTYKKYVKHRNTNLRKKLKNNILRNRTSKNDYDYAKFKLVNGKCNFLDKDNLCSIYKELGEKNMCHTCKIYPRMYDYVNDVIQESLTLSCVEAAKLVLLNKDLMEFEITQDSLPEMKLVKRIRSEDSDKILEKYFTELREFSIDLIQNRKFSIEERIIILGLFFKSIDKNIQEKDSVLELILKYKNDIENGYYNDISEKINLDNMIDIQFSILFSLCNNIIPDINTLNERYKKNIFDMIEGLELNLNEIEKSKIKYISTYKGLYKDFIEDKEYVYENYLVNYIFTNLFPYNKDDDIIYSYMNLVVNFILIKFNVIGLCAYYAEEMDLNHLVCLIQNYTKSLLHDVSIDYRIQEYLKSTNQNTINHMILMIGK